MHLRTDIRNLAKIFLFDTAGVYATSFEYISKEEIGLQYEKETSASIYCSPE